MKNTIIPPILRPLHGVHDAEGESIKTTTPPDRRSVPGDEIEPPAETPAAKDKKKKTGDVPAPAAAATLIALLLVLQALFFPQAANAQGYTTNPPSVMTNGYFANTTNPPSAITNGFAAQVPTTNAPGSFQTFAWNDYGLSPASIPGSTYTIAATNGLAWYLNIAANPLNAVCGWYTNAPTGMVGKAPNAGAAVWYTNVFTGYYIVSNATSHKFLTSDSDWGFTNGIYGPNTWDAGYNAPAANPDPNHPNTTYTIYRF